MVSKIIYTKTDEAPFLATHSLLPIIKAFTSKANIEIEIRDISLSGRILAAFPDFLENKQRVDDDLLYLGELVTDPLANIIKLPNISASLPQLKAAIDELQNKGYPIPYYPESDNNQREKEIKSRYDKIKGSAVNPVLREGNSDRRAPIAVKNYAKLNPHDMGLWEKNSKSHVATMKTGDFYYNEQSLCIKSPIDVRIEFLDDSGERMILKDKISLLEKEVIDATFMSKKDLLSFLDQEIKNAKEEEVLFSLHMKATMMKVSDPIIFGYVIRVFFKDLIKKHKSILNRLGVDFSNGFGDLEEKIKSLPDIERLEIERDIKSMLDNNPDLAMVDSAKGITNLHVPSDVIIDASMPAMIRNSGKMWNKEGDIQDTKAVIPDSSYAGIYSATIDFCKIHGSFDPSKMGTVPNVGLMAKKAEEYGSHDKTFEIPRNGIVSVIDSDNNVLIEHNVEAGDIWRMCQTKDDPIKNWVKLAVDRAKATGWPAIFWLNKNRAHDAQIIDKVKDYLKLHDTSNLEIEIMDPYSATLFTLERVRNGENTISVTGNVLRDYLTDLFPILELGTSAKMLSIVPLMNGGGLFETGAGGSAPKHVHQLIKEGHLRWDSLGEFLALAASLDHLADNCKNARAKILSKTLNAAIELLLKNGKSPRRSVGELDNKGSHFYLSLYWSLELANQSEDSELQSIFKKVSDKLSQNEEIIIRELSDVEGRSYNIKGYYFPDILAINNIMRPSVKFNNIIDNL